MSLPESPPTANEDALLGHARAVLAERFGVDDWRALPQRIEARKSSTRMLESARMDRRVALRLYRNPAAAAQQAHALRHGAALGLQGEGFDVPDLYAEFAGQGALLVEWVPVPHLERVLIRAAALPTLHWRAVRACGAWLRRFHELGGIATTRFDSGRYAAQFEARVAGAQAGASRLAGDALWRAGRAALERRLGEVDGETLPDALAHGDFTSTNILVGGSRVTGIDAWAELRLPVAEDLARMVVYLAMGDLLPIDARLRPVGPERRRAQRALIEGYGTDLAPPPGPWRALLLFETLARWLAIEERLVRRASLPESWKRGGLRALLRWLALD